MLGEFFAAKKFNFFVIFELILTEFVDVLWLLACFGCDGGCWAGLGGRRSFRLGRDADHARHLATAGGRQGRKK